MKLFLFRQSCYFYFFGGGVAGADAFGADGCTLEEPCIPSFILTIWGFGDGVGLVSLVILFFLIVF